jgi:hypothetical protein
MSNSNLLSICLPSTCHVDPPHPISSQHRTAAVPVFAMGTPPDIPIQLSPPLLHPSAVMANPFRVQGTSSSHGVDVQARLLSKLHPVASPMLACISSNVQSDSPLLSHASFASSQVSAVRQSGRLATPMEQHCTPSSLFPRLLFSH